MIRRNRILTSASATALLLALGSAGHAAVSSVGGQGTQIAPPPSVTQDQLESDTAVFVFDEHQNVTLSSDVNVNITQTGVYDQWADLTPGIIPAGTTVDSHLIHTDPVTDSPPTDFAATFTFDSAIIGIIVRADELNATDAALGAPGTVYPTGYTFRQLALNPNNDSSRDVVIHPDQRTITVELRTTVHLDQLRVITAEGGVPFDVKPRSCRNPLNVTKRGVTPTALLGTAGFDVRDVDVSTVRLEGVAPVRSAFEDVATPYTPFLGKSEAFDCTRAGRDGFLDLTLKFDTRQLVAALGPVSNGQVVVVQITGQLHDGTPFVGEDVIVILKRN